MRPVWLYPNDLMRSTQLFTRPWTGAERSRNNQGAKLQSFQPNERDDTDWERNLSHVYAVAQCLSESFAHWNVYSWAEQRQQRGMLPLLPLLLLLLLLVNVSIPAKIMALAAWQTFINERQVCPGYCSTLNMCARPTARSIKNSWKKEHWVSPHAQALSPAKNDTGLAC